MIVEKRKELASWRGEARLGSATGRDLGGNNIVFPSVQYRYEYYPIKRSPFHTWTLYIQNLPLLIEPENLDCAMLDNADTWLRQSTTDIL